MVPLAVWILLTSAVAFALYGIDKMRAQAKEWRISENTLLMAGLLGGWPGALIAQNVFRHKRRKKSFMAAFWITVVMNIIGTTVIVINHLTNGALLEKL